MRKSNLQLLQEAAEVGDLDKVRELTAKIGRAAKPVKKAPSKPAKASTAKKATPVKAKTKKAADEPTAAPKRAPRKRIDLEIDAADESSYIAPSRAPGHGVMDGRVFTGPDGKEHRYGRKVSLAGTKFVNKFDPGEFAPLPTKQAKLDKKLTKLPRTPRPGERGAQREKVSKIQVKCSVCGDTVSVYPWEAEGVEEAVNPNFRCNKKRCLMTR